MDLINETHEESLLPEYWIITPLTPIPTRVLLFFVFYFFINSTVTMERADLKFSTLGISIGNTRALLKNKQTLKVPIIGSSKKKRSKNYILFFFSIFFYSFLNFLSNQIERGNTVAALFSERKPRFLSSP